MKDWQTGRRFKPDEPDRPLKRVRDRSPEVVGMIATDAQGLVVRAAIDNVIDRRPDDEASNTAPFSRPASGATPPT